jgi:hypothetical protein
VGESLRVDGDALAAGQLIVEFDWPLEGRRVELRAIYPDTFPRLRPTVQLRGDPSTFPKRHCSPDEGNLCLLGRDSRQWRQQWTLADLLESQLADALNDSGHEDPQGEPAEVWWNGHALSNSFCLIDSAWNIGAATKGELRLRYNYYHGQSDRPEFKALVAELRDDGGQTLAQWSEPVPGVVQSASKETTVPWIYIDEVLLPTAVQSQLDDLLGRFKLSSSPPKVSPVLNAQWFAVLYKTELQHGQVGLGWLFLVAYGRRQDFQQKKKTPVAIVRTFRAGASDIGARAPSFQGLRDKKAAVFGLGAIGAPVALELARNGCALLRLVDHDLIEPGNSIRWPLGASAWGVPKGVSLKAFIETEYPWTRVEQESHHIGVQAGDDMLMQKVLAGIDIAVDATTSYGVTTALSDYCAERGVPLVCLYASPPLTGGVVARYAPGSGCPTCLEFAHHDGSVPRAPGFDDESGMLQPPGCAERTFTGASFDLQELSLEAVRLVVQTLGAPATDSVVHTLSLAADGQRTSPSWRVDRLPKFEKCACVRRV